MSKTFKIEVVNLEDLNFSVPKSPGEKVVLTPDERADMYRARRRHQTVDTLRVPKLGKERNNGAERGQDRFLRKQSETVMYAAASAMITAMRAANGLSTPPLGKKVRGLIDAHPEAPLLYAMAEDNFGRHFFSPGALSEPVLRHYMDAMSESAFSYTGVEDLRSTSLQMALPLLNAGSWTSVHRMLHGALEALYYPMEELSSDGAKPDYLSDVTLLCGFGPQARFIHTTRYTTRVDDLARRRGEPVRAYKQRVISNKYKMISPFHRNGQMSLKQRWLLDAVPPDYGFAEYLITQGECYGASLEGRVEQIKIKAVANATAAWVPGEEITPLMFERLSQEHERQHPNRPPLEDWLTYTNQEFQRAIHMVYSKPWADLMVTGDFNRLLLDKEVVLARSIIQQLCSGSNIHRSKAKPLPGAYFMALGLLTGVPVLSWVKFAIEELARRGEGFINENTLDELQDAVATIDVAVMPGEPFYRGLISMRHLLREAEQSVHPGVPQVLRSGRNLMWTYGDSPYHLKSTSGGDGFYTCKPDRRLLYR